MSKKIRRSKRQSPVACFESLENRELLTTITAGQTFVYLNSQDEVVRIDVSGAGTVIDVFAFNKQLSAAPQGDLVNLPGLLYDQANPGTLVAQVVWDNDPGLIFDDTGTNFDWVKYSQSPPSNLLLSQRGAETEIYAIYISSCDASSKITIQTVSGTPVLNTAWYAGNGYASTTLPLINTAPNTYTSAPAGSGGVIIGAKSDPFVPTAPTLPTVADDLRHTGVRDTGDNITGLPAMGNFPGGTLYAGITVSGAPVSPVTASGTSGLGANVGASASDGTDLFAVDNSADSGLIVDSSVSGRIGADVESLATDAAGNTFAADSTALSPTDPRNILLGTTVNSLAANPATGVLYFVENTTNRLFSVTPTGTTRGLVGTVTDSVSPWTYSQIQAMDFNGGTLYAIGQAVGAGAPAAPQLITIDTGNAHATRVTALPAGFVASTIAFDRAGTTLYGVDASTNSLVTIDTTTGVVTTIGALMAGGVNIPAVTGLDFVYSATSATDTAYAVTATDVYTVDPATGNSTLLRTTTLLNMTGMAYSQAQPGVLWTSEQTGGGAYLAQVRMGASLLSVDTSNGASALAAAIVDATNGVVVYTDVHAMDFDGATLYAVATSLDITTGATGNPALITVNAATGLATKIGDLSGDTANLTGIAFNSLGTLYGVNDATRYLYTVNTSTGAATRVSLVQMPAGANFVGIDFYMLGATEVLFGVTTTDLWKIDTTPGDQALSAIVGNTGMSAMSSLSVDPTQPGYLWSTELSGSFYHLTQISLATRLMQVTGSNVSVAGLVVDSSDPTIGYTNVQGMDFDGSGTLFATGYAFSLDDPSTTTGPFLLTIDTTTGQATPFFSAALASPTGFASIAFDPSGNLFGVVGGTSDVVQISLIDGSLSATVFTIDVPGITGIDFDVAGQLFAVDSTDLYQVNLANGHATSLLATGMTGMTSLTQDPGVPGQLFTTVPDVNGRYQVFALSSTGGGTQRELGSVNIGGTLCGTLNNPIGGITVTEMGFLFGKVAVNENLEAVVLHQSGGSLGGGRPVHSGDPDSWIHARGMIGGIYCDAGTLASLVKADGDPGVTSLSSIVNDLGSLGLLGAATTINTTQANAQIIATSSSTAYVFGNGYQWYALPLKAGQTIVIDARNKGHNTDLTDPTLDTFLEDGVILRLLDSQGRVMDTLGWETVEDQGIPSIGTTQKPITFTPMAADTYYLEVGFVSDPLTQPATNAPGAYTLKITNAPVATLGGIRTGGDLDGSAAGGLPGYDPNYPEDTPQISTYNGGNIGEILAAGNSAARVRTFGGGQIYGMSAGSIPGGFVASEGDVGFITTTVDYMEFTVWAGYYGTGTHNTDANIQNVTSATHIFGYFYASGDIGVFDASGNVGGVINPLDLVTHPFWAYVNFDSTGPAGHVDLFRVGGDWGALAGGIPHLLHGPGGDIGYVSVTGNIYVNYGGWVGLANPTVVNNGASSTLHDDGGGAVTIAPSPVVDPTTGNVTIPTYSYTYIGVDDSVFPGLGAGGALARVTLNGTATFTTTGSAQIGVLDMTGLLAGSTLSFAGTGQADVYYVTSDGDVNLTNSTTGSLISGSITGNLTNLVLKGTLGYMPGHSGAWVFGRDAAPATADPQTEPQYGYFRGTINGLDVGGNVGTISLGGALGDLRVVGSVTSVTVNSDHVTPAGGWDGVYGLVWSQQRLWSIEVGNGLADDGGGDVARAAIMSSASIGKVTVSGPHYTINGTPFGELNGSIIGGQDEILVLPDPNDPSKTINVPVDAVGEVLGTNGAYLTGNVISGELDAFRSDLKSYLTSNGTIGTVSFAGAGAMITGATIAGSHIRTVSTSADSNGIVSSTFMSTFPAPNLYAIGSVAAGGPGLSFCTFRVNGGSIGAVSGVGPVADIHDNFFFATDSLQSLTARNIYWNELHMPGLVGSITAKQDVHDNVAIVGAMGAVTSPGDFLANDFTVGGQIASITVGKTFNSRVVAQGPTANIKSVSVNGDISGWIESGSQIGKIVSKTGTIYATIITDSGAQPNVQLIQAISFQGYLGLAGNLVTLQVSSTLGSIGDVFTIGGSLGTLRVIGTAAVPSDLNSSFNVAGSIGTINVDGTLYGDITAQGDLNAVMLKGDLGGWVDTDADGILDTIVGGLQITGAINTLSMPANHSIFANVSVGGSINAITLKGGSIVGTMTSRYGKFGKISLTNGSVTGSLTSNGIDSLSVAGGNVTGDITLPKGSLKSLKMTGGTLSGNIDVQNGTIDSLSLVNVATTAGKRISASRGIGKAVIGAGMASDLVSGRGINSLTINGDVTGNISVENAVKSITIKGTINGATLRVGDRLDALTVNGLVNALVSSAGSIGKLTVKGNVTGSQVLAGLDVGADYVVSAPGGDDLLSPGSIGAVNISGTLTGSLLSAGVGAGADGDMTTWGDNTISWGLSSIGKGKIGGFGAGNILMADTSVDPALAAAATAGGGTVYVDTPTLVLVAPFGPNVFGIAAGRTTLAEPDGLALTLTGPGLASYDGAGNLYFEGTTSASKLTLSFSGTYGTTINVVGGEDSSLSAIVLASGITLGSVTIDGTVGALAASAANTSTWHLGDMGTLTLAGAQGMTLTANNITKWTFTGANTGGTFNAGAVGTLLVGGATDSDFTFDGAKSVTVRGNLGGDWISWSPIPTFTVAGNLSGSVALPNGDLNKLSVSGALDGVINVGQQTLSRGGGPAALYSGGLIGQVAVTGNFGGAANSSLRASGDIKSMTVRGAFLGLLSTSGALVSLTVGGDMSGRVWSAGTINSVKVGSMTSALLTSSTDILTVKITGDMTGSNIAAGFDPGDAGYNLALGGEAGNVQIDALTPLADQAPGNADTVLGGTIKLVTIGGGMYASAIAAAVNPGADGFFGSADDVAGGSGHVTKVVVAGMIFGSVNLSETYGVFATSAMPTVFIFGKQPFTSNGNASVGLV